MTLLRHVSLQYAHYEHTVSENFGNGNSDHFANQFCSWLAREGKIEGEKALPQIPKDVAQFQVGLIKVASASVLSLNME
jgi:hypothetical protein